MEHKARFALEMQDVKERRLRDKQELWEDNKKRENEMRYKINNVRETSKRNILYNKHSIFEKNKL